MKPVICMITDRHRLGAAAEELLVARVKAAARAGVHLIQIRERDLDGRPLLHLTTRCVAAVRGTTARILVNDRVDVALAAGAHGVHLRGDSMPAARARRIVPPGFLIGRSVHARDEALQAAHAGGLDYLIFGTVFPTDSKPDRDAAGVRALAELIQATAMPVLAVGGVTPGTAPLVARAGAAGVAAIGPFANPSNGEDLQVVVSQVNMAFDTMRDVS